MIPLLLDMAKNGVYNKVFFIANVIEMPTRAMNQITAPIIAKAWEHNDVAEIRTVYKKASNNLFVIGSFFFLLIWYVLDDLIAISANPDAFPDARNIFLLLASSKLLDMLTSVNSQIITYSKAYRYNLLFMLFLGISNLILNYILIGRFGLVGAAMATALSLLMYNVLKLAFIQLRFRMHPFSWGTMKTMILFGVLLGLSFIVDLDFNPFMNLGLKSLVILIIFGGIVYKWHISEDINAIINKLAAKIFNKHGI
jgi:O-antigen/teichoic acid export membrane protein